MILIFFLLKITIQNLYFFHFNTANPDFPDVFLLLSETNNNKSVYALSWLLSKIILDYYIKILCCRCIL